MDLLCLLVSTCGFKGILSRLLLASCDVEIKNKAFAFEKLPSLYALRSYFVSRIKGIRSLSSS